MKAEFNLNRELKNRLFCQKQQNPGTTSYHFHSQTELYLVHSGAVEIWVNEHREILKAGELSVALSYDPHGYRMISPGTVTCLIIPADFCNEFMESARNKRLQSPFIKNKDIYDEINRCCEEILSGCNHVKQRGSIYWILGAILEQMCPEERGESMDIAPASRILLYINENYNTQLTLRTIAEALGYNPSYLSRYFKECFHMGINQYITLTRLRTAVQLMQKQKSISHCAYESGFNSIRTFYRCFYEEFKCTPKAYLNEIHSGKTP